MTIRGKVKNGVVVLDTPDVLAEGTEVRVSPVKPTKARTRKSGLMKFAGKAKGLPRDAARNLDHYLYGHPKRGEAR
jgi:hypothetical protein